MELTLNQLANFPNPLARPKDLNQKIVIQADSLSPSDIPDEVEVEHEENKLHFDFQYSIMERLNALEHYNTEFFSVKYSSDTGRIYYLSLNNSVFSKFKSQMNQIISKLGVGRAPDNLRFGVRLIGKIIDFL
ncbi:hypothetical protein ACFSQJ_18005 [Croceitalea marina]|uniref:Uncharacterized protein n=1 Tax=Croceitalea marina TaxID=1775166 RepID=A0ABW5N211_9FLAO